eukprot:5587941-Alexandrium_andersonii.AAC.1
MRQRDGCKAGSVGIPLRSPNPLVKVSSGPRIQPEGPRSQHAQRAKRPSPWLGIANVGAPHSACPDAGAAALRAVPPASGSKGGGSPIFKAAERAGWPAGRAATAAPSSWIPGPELILAKGLSGRKGVPTCD